jgi:hypothetical protein
VAGVAFCYDWLLGGCTWTFSPFHRGVVTPYALEVGAAGEGDNRHHAFSAFRAARDRIHEVLPIFAPITVFPAITRNRNFCSIRAFRAGRHKPSNPAFRGTPTGPRKARPDDRLRASRNP